MVAMTTLPIPAAVMKPRVQSRRLPLYIRFSDVHEQSIIIYRQRHTPHDSTHLSRLMNDIRQRTGDANLHEMKTVI